MIETEEQRRWWFATHPEYSWSHRGIRGRPEKEKNENEIDPRDVDEYVDNALKYETDGSVIALLKSVKRNFGTQAREVASYAKRLGDAAAELITDNKQKGLTSRKYSNEEYRRMGIPTPEEDALPSDPHTYLDVVPYKRFLTAPISALKDLFRSTARGMILNAAEKGGTRPPARLPPKGTPERREIEAARKRGRDAKISEERADIKAGGKGSGIWTQEELEGIRRTGKFPDDVRWHHDPTVANRPDLAGDPRVVYPLRGGNKGHLWKGHQGNYRNPRKEDFTND